MSTVTRAQKVFFFDDGEMVEGRLGLVTGLSHGSLTNMQIRALCVPVPYCIQQCTCTQFSRSSNGYSPGFTSANMPRLAQGSEQVGISVDIGICNRPGLVHYNLASKQR